MGKVSSAIINTENVYGDLEVAAKASGVPIKDVDVDILAVHTKYMIGEGEIQSVEDLSIFDNDEFFLNPELHIEQSYRVRYYDKTVTEKTHLPKIAIASNKTLTKIRAKILADSEVRYTADLADELENAINRTLLKYGFLIGVRSNNLKNEVRRVASLIRVNGALIEDVIFDVAQGIEPLEPIDDAMIYHYKNKVENADDPNSSVLSVVSENETIIEYVKSKPGRNGRNLKGELIAVTEAKNENAVEIKTTEKIRKEEDDKSIRYIAISQGYVSDEGGVYDIKEKLEVNSVNLKTTGSIEAGLDSDVTINVTESDVLKDAIGPGMSIETSTLNVQGSVAEGASIKARSVTIGGLTHAKSAIESVDADIATHLGTLTCSGEAKIDRLEGGSVRARVVNVNVAVGGSITGEEVYINELNSNCTITAAKLVVINQLRGRDNRIIIDIMQTPEYAKNLKVYTDEKQTLGRELHKLKANLQDKLSLINSNTSSVGYVKKRIEELSATGTEAPASLLNKLKDYQSLVYEYNNIAKHYRTQKERYDEVIAILQKMQDMIFDSKVVNKGRWVELNDIKFELIEPRKSICYVTKENELARVITIRHLEIAGEHIYEIKKSNEMPQELL